MGTYQVPPGLETVESVCLIAVDAQVSATRTYPAQHVRQSLANVAELRDF